MALLGTANIQAMESSDFIIRQDNTKVNNYRTNRPEAAKRLFVSQAVEQQIAHIKQLLTNARLAWMFENCFPNTLDTTVHFDGKDDTFVYTGDIHAMWLRDSGAQVWPYVQLANKDPELKKDARRRHQPPVQVYQHRPVRQCLQYELRRRRMDERPHCHEARTA